MSGATIARDGTSARRRRVKAARTNTTQPRAVPTGDKTPVDIGLLTVVLVLLVVGLVMLTSASIAIAERQYGTPLFFLYRQLVHVSIGVVAAGAVLRIPLQFWEKYNGWLFILGLLMLVLVLLPGVGREVNGSIRWIGIAGLNVQPSEIMKLAVVMYVASYLVRHVDEVRASAWGFLKPILLLTLVAAVLLLEPDFGAAVVIMATALAMMFLGGVRLSQFGLLLLVVVLLLAALALSSPYRLERLTTFLNPWDDPFNHGFQLTQALIAFGHGEWFGRGLGGSIQKLFYLPEAHTDFLFAVIAEELGLLGAVLVVALYAFVVMRAFGIATRAELAGQRFGGYLAFGLGLWIGMQAFVNLGVNMGLLPTKGLTLPLMSYGGSSMIVSCVAFALLLRVDLEVRAQEQGTGR